MWALPELSLSPVKSPVTQYLRHVASTVKSAVPATALLSDCFVNLSPIDLVPEGALIHSENVKILPPTPPDGVNSQFLVYEVLEKFTESAVWVPFGASAWSWVVVMPA